MRTLQLVTAATALVPPHATLRMPSSVGMTAGVGGADGAASDGAASDGEVIENCAAGAASGVAGSSSSSSLESASQSITFCLEALSMASRGCSKKAALGLLAVLAIAQLFATYVWLGAATIELKRLETYSSLRIGDAGARREFFFWDY